MSDVAVAEVAITVEVEDRRIIEVVEEVVRALVVGANLEADMVAAGTVVREGILGALAVSVEAVAGVMLGEGS